MNPPKSIGASPTFGSLLDGLFSQVDDTIQQALQNAKDAGVELELEAGREIALAIENAKNAYKDSLDYTIDKVSVAAKNAFDRLSSMVDKFQKTTGNELKDLEIQAQQLLNTLPFSSKQPQLSNVTPRYIVVDDVARDSLVTFKGNFPYSAKAGFEPSLDFSGNKCLLVDSNTQSLTFQIPPSAFKDAPKNQYSYKTGNLQVPWDDGWVMSHKTEFDYKVGLGALPQTAGTGSAEYVAHDIQHNAKAVSSQAFNLDGNNWYPEHWHTVDTPIVPEQGWTIDLSKPPSLVVVPIHGKHKQEIVSVAPNQIVVRVELYCKEGHDIGIMQFRVDYNVYQDVPIEKKRVENFVMNWKDSLLLVPQKNETISKVIFNDYKGTHQEYGAPTLDGILQIEAEGNGSWKIWAEPPQAGLSKELADKIAFVHMHQHLLNLRNIGKATRVVDKTKMPFIEQASTTTQTTQTSSQPEKPIVEEIKKT